MIRGGFLRFSPMGFFKFLVFVALFRYQEHQPDQNQQL